MQATIAATSHVRDPRAWWPWLMLLATFAVAVWHAVDFPEDIDPEFPRVARPNFSPAPPPAYRLAEPGDTIDRVAIYVSALAILLAVTGLVRDRGYRRAWSAGLSFALAGFWFAANPLPTVDGWHGLGWAAIWGSSSPIALRLGLGAAALALAGLALWGVRGWIEMHANVWRAARSRGIAWLVVAGVLLMILRVANWPRIEPVGYWPHWAFVGALMTLCAALVRTMPARAGTRRQTLGRAMLGTACWYGLVCAGIWLTWFHRPLERLQTVVPGRIYMSAMPTARGLEIAQDRLHFKTIINLFPEDTPLRSPRLPEELRFASAHGIHYVGSPSEVSASNDFLDQTLRLARDPDAWPILVHCHGCMDRTPAWVGIYRYVVEGWKLDDVMRFIEAHRGYRPKASVTLLYNRVLPRLAPDRVKDDPTAALLQRCAQGSIDPYYRQVRDEPARANPKTEAIVESGSASGTSARRPSLTPRR